MGTEKLKFKLELYATMWDKPPVAEIFVDGKSYFNGPITGTEQKPDVIEFEPELEENNDYKLTIVRTNKVRGQTKVNEKGDITHDQLLNIKSIEIDVINLGPLIYEGVYTPIYPEAWAMEQKQQGNLLPETLKNVTQLGHNGKWCLSFSTPFYIWILENLY